MNLRVRIKALLILIVVFFSGADFSQAKEKYSFVILGESNASNKGFENYAAPLLENLKQAEYSNTTAVLIGGNKNLEKLVLETTGKSPLSATTESVDSALSAFVARIKNGEIKSGDKILVSVLTHGVPQKIGEKTHSLELSDQKLFSLDRLKNLKDAAEAAGVRLAILDLSCFSGATLALSSKKTCVVAGASSDTLASETFISQMLQRLRPNQSVETVFLEARRAQGLDSWNQTTTYPQISSPAGAATAQLLYQKGGAIFQTVFGIPYEKQPDEVCGSRSEELLRIIDTFSSLEKALVKQIPESKEQLDDMVLYRWLLTRHKALSEEYYRGEREYAFKAPAGTVFRVYNRFQYRGPYTGYYRETYLDPFKGFASSQDEKARNQWLALQSDYAWLLAKLEELGTKPDVDRFYEKRSKLEDEFKLTQRQLHEVSRRLSERDKQVYDQIYRGFPVAEQNPCKDFEL